MELMISHLFSDYEAFIQSLPVKDRYEPSDLLVPELLMYREKDVDMYYAPHNDWLNAEAKMMIVGITPGWSQMELAFRAARRALARNRSSQEACREAKIAAGFAGPMRGNLVRMLDELKVPHYLGVPDSRSLFDEDCRLMHTTSLLRYPVFVSGKNYNGHKPALGDGSHLYEHAHQSIVRELLLLDNPLVIPLGKTVEAVFRRLLAEGLVQERQVLWGFPHPSGANGHRHLQFERAREQLERTLASFAAGL